MLKVAQYAAQLEDYDKAIQIYEQVNQVIAIQSDAYGNLMILIFLFHCTRLPAHVWKVHC